MDTQELQEPVTELVAVQVSLQLDAHVKRQCQHGRPVTCHSPSKQPTIALGLPRIRLHAASAADARIQKLHRDPDRYAWDTRWLFAQLSSDGHPARHRATVYQVRRPCQPFFFEFVFNYAVVGPWLAAKGCASSCKPKGGLPSATPEANVGTLPTTVFETQTYEWTQRKTILGLIFLSFASMIAASVSEWNRHSRSRPMQCRRLAPQKVELLERLEFLERHRKGGCQRVTAHDYPGRLPGRTKSEPKEECDFAAKW